MESERQLTFEDLKVALHEGDWQVVMKRILVTGDLAIDWLQYRTPPLRLAPTGADGSDDWQTSEGIRSIPRPGGALLIAHFLKKRLSEGAVISPDLREEALARTPPDVALHTRVEIGKFELDSRNSDARGDAYRIKTLLGYAGPKTGNFQFPGVTEPTTELSCLVVNDRNITFRHKSELWPSPLQSPGSDLPVIVKTHPPLCSGPLWARLAELDLPCLVIVLNANDLRRRGLNVSRSLSWERTAKDFVWHLEQDPRLAPLRRLRAHIVTRFGLEAAIVSVTNPNLKHTQSTLWYVPSLSEGEIDQRYPGDMHGHAAAFVAALAASILERGEIADALEMGIHSGLLAAQRLHRVGYLSNAEGDYDYPYDQLFSDRKVGEEPLAVVEVPGVNLNRPRDSDPDFWCILKDPQVGATLEEMAMNTVLKGPAVALQHVPSGIFGHFWSVDRAEIESFRSIRNLFREYLKASKVSRPLSIAVFGPPGSGKSFGVQEVANDVMGKGIELLEFNMAQFTGLESLWAAFHIIRDSCLKGNVPVAFFDEFDCHFGGHLGWLKYFLAPMQDGRFREGTVSHPIGRAIFVFAGGTAKSLTEFTKADSGPGSPERCEYIQAKGPDFESRLRGFVNILGPNRADDEDQFYVLRRAMLLRSLIERRFRRLLSSGRAQVDEGLIRAFLLVKEYKHGARSMEAILDMSTLADRQEFSRAELPSPEQLRLHTDVGDFCSLLATSNAALTVV